MTAPRRARIADQIQRELAELIRLELRDPRVGMVTLTAVELSHDQSHAKIYFTVLGPESAAEAARLGLERASGFLRSGLAHRLNASCGTERVLRRCASGFLRSGLAHRLSTRSVPQLAFAYDESIERGARLTRLIDEAVKPTAPSRRRRGGARR